MIRTTILCLALSAPALAPAQATEATLFDDEIAGSEGAARATFEADYLGMWRPADGKCNDPDERWTINAERVIVGDEPYQVTDLALASAGGADDAALVLMLTAEADGSVMRYRTSREGDVLNLEGEGEDPAGRITTLVPCTFGSHED
ncbi:MAG: hypothetical protein ACU0CO_18030 [Shimia sp.]